MLFKIAALKNFAITVKKTPVLESLFNKFAGLWACTFIKRRLQHWCFLKKFLKNSFFCRTPSWSLYFFKFFMIIEVFGRLWAENWHFSYFLCHCFDFLHGCFHTKIFSKCKFRTYYNLGSSTILIESLNFRNNSRIAVRSPNNLMWKLWIWMFWILYYVIISL